MLTWDAWPRRSSRWSCSERTTEQPIDDCTSWADGSGADWLTWEQATVSRRSGLAPCFMLGSFARDLRVKNSLCATTVTWRGPTTPKDIPGLFGRLLRG